MNEEERLIAHFNASRAEFEKRSKEMIPVRMKIGLEGFVSNFDKFEVAPELVFRKAPLEERQAFYGRTNNPKDIEIKAYDNEYFAEFDFQIPRGAIHSLAPGNGINRVSIFFAIASSKVLNIVRGNFYLVNGDEFRSAGFYTTPNEYRFTTKEQFSNDELNSMKTLWPDFKNQFENNFSFALSCTKVFLFSIKTKSG